jgi:hypothetical protein
MRLIKGENYNIEWFDIHHTNEWTSKEKLFEWAKGIKPIKLRGQKYLGSTEHFHLFSSGEAADGDAYDCSAIPKTVIHKLTKAR